MKQIFTVLALILLTAGVFAQTPEKMSYQAVIRNNSDQLVINQGVGMQISVLQGSITGSSVYTETQSITTNANGLVSIEIGMGISTDDFSAIDWGSGPYFIKTETDPSASGGVNYTITGTSQLMSVPYALHAKTAESITGTITETDPIFTAWDKSTGISISQTQISDLNYFTNTDETDPVYSAWDKDYASLINQPTTISTTQASEITANTIKNTYPTADATKLTGIETGAQVNVNADWNATTGTAEIQNKPDLSVYLTTEVDGSVTNEIELPTTANPGDMSYWDGTAWVVIPATENEGATLQMIGGIPSWQGGTPPPLVIGSYRYGGVVFYIDGSGQHGLVCDVNDLTDTDWGCMSTPITGAEGTAISTGAQNTIDIKAECTTTGIAADICDNLTLNGHSDWFLPSKDELNKIYQNKAVINTTATANGGVNFSTDRYWSSSETIGTYSKFSAWSQAFSDGYQTESDKSDIKKVRAVRAF